MHCRISLAMLMVFCLLGPLNSVTDAMVFKSDLVRAQWDTWAYEHEGTYYLYYLITEHGPGEGFGVATSSDGVHWKDHGWAIRQSERNSFYLGTGSVWKSVDFEETGRFLCNYSEHRKDAQGRNIQNILFAWSTDLIHWTKFDDETMFKIDSEYYSPTGRWDCIYCMPRDEGGYWGTWTATGQNVQGTVGIGYTEDGLKWNTLPAPSVDPGVSESGAFYSVGGRIYAMFGRGGMWSYTADRVTGPYKVSPKNPSLITRPHTYFSRFLPTAEGLLVNHHSMSGTTLQTKSMGRSREVTYVAPFKRAEVDHEGVMRWKYWSGNEALKGDSVPATFTRVGELQVLDALLDFNRGIVAEGAVALPGEQGEPVTIVFAAGTTSYAVRILQRGEVEMGTVDATGGHWRRRYEIDRQWKFGDTARLRILARAGMMEIYLDDHFMQCWTMGCYGEPKIKPGFFSAGADQVTDLKLWQMSLEPAKTPPIEHPLKASSAASSVYSNGYRAEFATDGDRSTRWCSSLPNGKQEWLQVALGQPQPIGRVEILWELAHAKGYQLSISNDATAWKVVHKTGSGDGGRDVVNGLNTSGRFLRLDCLERGTEHGFSIFEVRVFSEASTSPDVLKDVVSPDFAYEPTMETARRAEFKIDKRYLNTPLLQDSKTAKRNVTIKIDGELLGVFGATLALEQADYYGFFDLSRHQGKTLTVEVDRFPRDLAEITLDDAIKGSKDKRNACP